MLKNLLPERGVNISPESTTFIIDETDNTVEQKIEQIVVSYNVCIINNYCCLLRLTGILMILISSLSIHLKQKLV